MPPGIAAPYTTISALTTGVPVSLSVIRRDDKTPLGLKAYSVRPGLSGVRKRGCDSILGVSVTKGVTGIVAIWMPEVPTGLVAFAPTPDDMVSVCSGGISSSTSLLVCFSVSESLF